MTKGAILPFYTWIEVILEPQNELYLHNKGNSVHKINVVVIHCKS